MKAYRLLEQAGVDLDDHAIYVAENGSLEVAARLFAAARETFTLLASQPQIGWRRDFGAHIPESVRFFRIRGFERLLVVYRPTEEGVDILRVLHSSRDLDALLSDELID